MIYSIMYACTLSMLICVPLPEYTQPFETMSGCRIYVAAMSLEYWRRHDSQHPYPNGRCRPWYQ